MSCVSILFPTKDPELYYKNFPSTLSNGYKNQVFIDEPEIRTEFYAYIASKVAGIYVHALSSPAGHSAPKLDDKKISFFGSHLQSYILDRLSRGNNVDLRTKETPIDELQELLKNCGIVLEADHLPMWSRVFLKPTVDIDEYLVEKGLHISILSSLK